MYSDAPTVHFIRAAPSRVAFDNLLDTKNFNRKGNTAECSLKMGAKTFGEDVPVNACSLWLTAYAAKTAR